MAVGTSTTTPYWTLVPTDPIKNVKWRIAMREAACEDVELQAMMRQAAFDDVLFWFSAFCWVFEPRPRPRILPFIPWPHQQPAIVTIDNAIGYSDVGIDKSRGEGATFAYCELFTRRWIRDPLFSAGISSRSEKTTDEKDNPDSVMWKIDFALKMLPYWMLPKSFRRSYSDHTLINQDNGANIVGYATTGDIARGGRRTVIAMDELAAYQAGDDYKALASSQHAADSRILVSTYLGDTGAYYDAMTEDNEIIKVILDWKDNPKKNPLLYVVQNGRPVAVRAEDKRALESYVEEFKERFDKLRRRGFLQEGSYSSPWRDRECMRPGTTPRAIAREIDRNPKGTVSKIFDTAVIERMIAQCARPPLKQGRLVFDTETCDPNGFVETENGELKLWCKVGLNREIPVGQFSISADVAAGTGGSHSSNSSATIINRLTGEQVGEWASNRYSPARFARVCVALAKWFNNAFVIWEANGPTGSAFTNEIVNNLQYGSIYYRPVEIEGLHKKTQKPGFWMHSDDVKLKVLEDFCVAMDDGKFIPRSKVMLEECLGYQWHNGKIVFSPSKRSGDDSDSEKSHGDRAVAAALGLVAMKDQPVYQDFAQEESVGEVPYFSVGWFMQRAMEGRQQRRDEWTGDLDDGGDGSVSFRDD